MEENKLFSQLIKNEVYAKVDSSVSITGSAFIGGNTYFNSCNWKWIYTSNKVTINNIDYIFEDSDITGYDYMVKDVDLSNITSLVLNNLTWFIGTYKEVNTDFVNHLSNSEREKLPMIWLSFNPAPKSRQNHDPLSYIGETHTFTMFFCASANFQYFRTEDHLDTRVAALNSYVDAFIEAIKSNKSVFYTDEVFETEKYYYPKFGKIEDSQKKTGETIIDSQLSAIELNISVQALKKCEC